MPVDAVLIAGPTASGKSAVALALAEELDGAVINADSMQVYAELRVLTARPSPDAARRAPHFLYGHVRASERYSAGRYQKESAQVLLEARAKRLLPIFVGGTGLYFMALTEGLSPIPPVPAEVRARVRRRFEALGRDAFFSELAERDETSAAKLRPSDTQRLLRAADVLEATGRPLSVLQDTRGEAPLRGLKVAAFVVSPSRDVLNQRIAKRLEDMSPAVVLEEASSLAGLDSSLPAARALGVAQFARHLAGEIGYADALAEAQLATRQYAKRQQTWFRTRMKNWTWLNENELSNIIALAKQELS